MTTPKHHSRPDGFDILLADHHNSTHDYEDHDADLRDVLRPWSRLSAEGKLGYIASAAAMYNVPFERFEQAAREAVGGQALPAGEHAYLRLHMEYQRTLWDHELPAFPREHPLPDDEPHRDFLDSLDGVLHVKFERLFNDYLSGKQHFADTDGQMRHWPELSAEGKVEHIARLAAVFDIPLSRFTEAVHDALDGQPLGTDEMACLRLQYHYAQQVRNPSPQPLPLARNISNLDTAQGQDPWLRGSIDPKPVSDELASQLFEKASASEKDQNGPGTVLFHGWLCEIEERSYPNGRLALVLVDVQNREDVAVATVNLPEAPLKPGEVFIKDYSENEGMLAALENAGIVKATGERVPSGFVDVAVAKILPVAHRLHQHEDHKTGRTTESDSGNQAPEPFHAAKPSRRNELHDALRDELFRPDAPKQHPDLPNHRQRKR